MYLHQWVSCTPLTSPSLLPSSLPPLRVNWHPPKPQHINSFPCVVLSRLAELKAEGGSVATPGCSSGSGTPQPVNNTVHLLAQALVQIEQGMERKFLKAPLGRATEHPTHPRTHTPVFPLCWRPATVTFLPPRYQN